MGSVDNDFTHQEDAMQVATVNSDGRLSKVTGFLNQA
jgi:hypothetical protein